jgi:hypothetical protein
VEEAAMAGRVRRAGDGGGGRKGWRRVHGGREWMLGFDVSGLGGLLFGFLMGYSLLRKNLRKVYRICERERSKRARDKVK